MRPFIARGPARVPALIGIGAFVPTRRRFACYIHHTDVSIPYSFAGSQAMTMTQAWCSTFVGVASGCFVFSAILAQETGRLPRPQAQPVAQRSEDSLPSSVRTSLAGVDKNNDGIRDDIEAFVERETNTSAQSPTARSSAVTRELSSTAQDNKKMEAEPVRRSCFDYLLLEPKDRALANQHLRTSSQNGTFGTHPCDPFVSPHLDRLFDTDFAELHLGPARLPTK